MRKLGTIVATLVLAGSALAGLYKPYSYSVTTNASVILPAANQAALYRTTNTVYSQGDVVIGTSSNGPSWYFWAVSGGVSATTAPNWKVTADVSDGTVTWRPHNQKRSRLYVQNNSTNKIFLGFGGQTPTTSGGVYLTQDGSLSYNLSAYQGELQAIIGGNASSTGTVHVQEVP